MSEPLFAPRPGDFEDLLHRASARRRRHARPAVAALVGSLLVATVLPRLAMVHRGTGGSLEMATTPPDQSAVPILHGMTTRQPVASPTSDPDPPEAGQEPASAPLVTATPTRRGPAFVTPPPPEAERTRTVEITIYDATTYDSALAGYVDPLYRFSHVVTGPGFRRLAVAAAGRADPGSGPGRAWVDDVEVERADGTRTTLTFDTEPVIMESTYGGDEDVLAWDGGTHRLVAQADSALPAHSNYESVVIAGPADPAVTHVTFRLTRTSGDTGDGAYWDLLFGLVPGDDERPLAPQRAAPYLVGNFVGVHMEGDGDADEVDTRSDDRRELLHGVVDGTEDPVGVRYSARLTYVVEIAIRA